MLRSASARRRRVAWAGVVCFAISVDGHCARVEAQLRQEVAGAREDGERDQACESSEERGGQERVGDPGRQPCAPRIAPLAPAAIVEKIAMPSVPPISWPVELRPEIIPASSSRAPVRIAIETETTAMPRPKPAISMPGQDVRR